MEISITDVVFDEEIYPRSSWSDEVVERYKEAIESGQNLPPILLETDTNRLIDGMHRWRARQQLKQDNIEVEYTNVPDGIPAKLYSASLNSTHGHQFSNQDLKALARDIVSKDPEFNVGVIAKMIARSERTLERWVSDLIEDRKKRDEEQRHARQVKVFVMHEAGMSNRKIASLLDIGYGSVIRDRQVTDLDHDDHEYTEAELWLAADQLRDIVDNVGDVVEKILAKRLPPMKIVLSSAFAKCRISTKNLIETIEKYRHVEDEDDLRSQMSNNIIKVMKLLEAANSLLIHPKSGTITDEDIEEFFRENHE